jgi:hypothetical protein
MHHLWATSGSAEIAPEALALTKSASVSRHKTSERSLQPSCPKKGRLAGVATTEIRTHRHDAA